MRWARKPQVADQVHELLLGYIRKRGLPVPEGKIDPDAGPADFGLDSLDAVAIVVELENHFNLALDRQQAITAKHFRDLVALVVLAQRDVHKIQ